jgi:hypothetical protein
MAATQFSQSTKQQSNRGGGKRRGNWRDEMRLPKPPLDPAPVLLIEGQWVDPNPPASRLVTDPATGQYRQVVNPFFKVDVHKVKLAEGKFRDAPCSAGPDLQNPRPCEACRLMQEGDPRITRGWRFLMEQVHLGVYHQVPAWNQSKNEFVRRQDGTFATESIECTNDCNFCRIRAGQAPITRQGYTFPRYNVADIVDVFGSRRYLNLGTNGLQDLGTWDDAIQSSCRQIRFDYDLNNQPILTSGRLCGGKISPESYDCATCNTPLLKIEAGTDPQQLSELSTAQQFCTKCSKYTAVKAYMTCEVCEQKSPHNLFSVVCHGLRDGEGTSTKLSLRHWQPLDEFARTVPPELLHGKTFKERLDELLSTGFDFPEMFKPLTAEEQLVKLGLMEREPNRQPGGYQAQPPTYMQPPAANGPPQQHSQPTFYPLPGGANQPSSYQGPPPYVRPPPNAFTKR